MMAIILAAQSLNKDMPVRYFFFPELKKSYQLILVL